MAQEIIIHSIKDQLLGRGHSVVPGLGVFMLKKYPARIDLRTETIHPPGYIVDFLNAPSISDYILAWKLAGTFGGDFGFWSQKLEDLSQLVRGGNQGEIVSLPGLGNFQCGEEPQFEMEDADAGWLTGYRTPLLCRPVKPDAAVGPPPLPRAAAATAGAASSSPEFVNKENVAPKNNHWKAVLVLLALALFLFGLLYFLKPGLSESGFEIPPDIADERLNQKPDLLPVDTSELDSTEEKGSSDDYVYRDYNDYHLNESPIEDLNESEGDYADIPETDSEPETESFREQPQADLQPYEDQKCIIITGSFSRMRNVGEMTDRLQNSGYAVYTENIGSLTRVGAVINCAGEDIEFHLNYIRTHIESGSWLLE